MILLNNLTMNIYSIIILIIIYLQIRQQGEISFYKTNLFLQVLVVTFMMLIFDSMGRLDGFDYAIYPFLNHVGNFMLFILIPMLPSIWLQYAHFQIFKDEKATRDLYFPLAIINLLNILMVIGNIHFGWYYYIDAANIYHRGNLYFISSLFTFLLLFYALMFIIKNRKNIDKKHYQALVLFPLVPFIGITIQSFVYGTSLTLPGVMVSIIIVFLNLQNTSMNKDFLTGANNRRKFDGYLNDKINIASREKSFSAIMLDLDNFKKINDTYGHQAGDQALIDAVKIIKDNISPRDFVARSGGDEFWIILNSDNQSDLNKLVRDLQRAFDNYNKYSSNPYDLNFSCGHAVYDIESKMSIEEFKHYLDKLMYKNKRISKNHIYL